MPDHHEVVQLGHLIVIRTEYPGYVRTRTIRVGTKWHFAKGEVPTHPADDLFGSPFASFFLNKKRGSRGVLRGCRGDQEDEYPVELIDILPPETVVDKELIDSWTQWPRTKAA